MQNYKTWLVVAFLPTIVLTALAIQSTATTSATPPKASTRPFLGLASSSTFDHKCQCDATASITNSCNCTISIVSFTKSPAACSDPPPCADLNKKCQASLTYSLVAPCPTGQASLSISAPCNGGGSQSRNCPGGSVTLGLTCAACAVIEH